MNRYEIIYTIGTEYLVTIDAYSVADATVRFEELYEAQNAEIDNAKELGVSHRIAHIAKAHNPFKNFDKSLHLVRGIGADNRIQVVARVTEDGLPVYRVEEMGSSFESIVCEDFDTLGEAINRANALLIEEEEVSGIEQERF